MKNLKRTLLIIGGSLMLLTAVLVWHIHLVTKPKANGHLANVQLARIDFDAALSAEEAASLRGAVDALPGVQHARVNDDRTNLVYAYDRAQQDQPTVFAVVKDLSSVPCERLVVTAEAAANGCPAMAKGGAQDKLGHWIADLIN
ncbi:MAG: hypothetical protein JNM62_10165 [Flavobacteriales bacterium]|nr:hypothetical protein [Flavobacteriales bacterium]